LSGSSAVIEVNRSTVGPYSVRAINIGVIIIGAVIRGISGGTTVPEINLIILPRIIARLGESPCPVTTVPDHVRTGDTRISVGDSIVRNPRGRSAVVVVNLVPTTKSARRYGSLVNYIRTIDIRELIVVAVVGDRSSGSAVVEPNLIIVTVVMLPYHIRSRYRRPAIVGAVIGKLNDIESASY
jgi:hypothetical protein